MDRSSYEGLDRPTTPPPSHVATADNSGASSNINRAAARAGPRQGNSRAFYVADHMIDARPQTGTAPDEQTEMRYPTRASELDHRRLQVPPSLLHDSSTNQLHAGAWRTSQSCVRCLTKDIRETCFRRVCSGELPRRRRREHGSGIPRWNSGCLKPKGTRMRDPVEFRRYAEECRRLAKMMPAEHRGTLLKIAEAWIECAQEAERD